MIRLEKAVIHTYRCIETEQSFETGNLTALMGRNEAGKTSVLEALAKANYYNPQDTNFHYNDVYDYPRRKKRKLDKMEKIPAAVSLTYRVDEKLSETIEQEMMLPSKSRTFSRITDYGGRSIVTENGFEYSVNSFLSAYAGRKGISLQKFTSQLMNVYDGKEFKQFLSRVEQNASEEEKKVLKCLAPYFENKHGWENPLNEYVYRRYLLPNIPKFLFYDEYYMLPSRVSVDKLVGGKGLTNSERTAKALLLLADIDLKKVLESNEFESYKTELEIVQAEFTDEFLKYWTNNKNLGIEFELLREEKADGQPAPKRGIFSWIKDKKQEKEYETFLEIRVQNKKNMVSLPLENRSRGFNWFFSFWVWFKAIQKENACPFVILLDEPGLNLHASAQKDLMRLMEDISRQDQIIFTTHSPYMLEDVKDRIYCIVEREGGSTIRALEDETDEETLLPIQHIKRDFGR